MSESVGEQLRLARQEHNFSLEQVARGTHIRLHYLEAMEAGDFSRLPSKAQARGFLRAYASYLGLDPASLLIFLNGEADAPAAAEPEATPAAAPPQAAPEREEALSFVDIGQTLRQQREILGLSLDDIERHTHLRQHYLLALEAGNLAGLPSPVQGRGMLHNYAAFLGLDPEPLLLKFAEGLQARLAAKQASLPRSPRADKRPIALPGPLRRWFSSDFLLGGLLVLSLAGFFVWGAIRINALRSSGTEPAPTVPSIAEALRPTLAPVLSPTPTASLEPSAEGPPPIVIAAEATEIEATAPATTGAAGNNGESETGPAGTEPAGTAAGEGTEAPAGSGGSIQVYITVHQRAWVRVTVDGEVAFEGRMLPGSAYSFDGSQQVEILTGNGAALQVFYNQRDLGTLGIYGEVVHRVFTLEGAVLPTPTITPTPTASATAPQTPAMTETPQPSPQP
jgi:cytoskeletal protein RodZ